MKKILSTLVLSAGILFHIQAQDKITFKLNPEQGKSIPMEMIMKTDVAGSQNIIMDMNLKMTMTATKVTDTDITYETKYTALKTDVDAGLMTISYDSSREPANDMEQMMASQLKPILESTLTIVMDKQAKVLQLDFPNVNDQAFDKSSMQSMSVSFPEKAVSIGESWETSTDMEKLGGSAKTTNTYVEKNAEGYKIDVNGVIKNQEGVDIGTVSGFYILDPVTHFTKSSNISTSIDMQGNKIISSVILREI